MCARQRHRAANQVSPERRRQSSREVTAARPAGGSGLLERDREIAAIEASLAAAWASSGRVVVIEGEAGIGKTALLAWLEGRAASRGMEIHAARGGWLEREFPFGVVRRLFEVDLARRPARERRALLAGAASAAALAIGVDGPPAAGTGLARGLHGLYWLCANLAERGPLLIVVDDAHWADAESLAWLGYMANRVDDLPILLAIGVRPAEAVAAPASLAGIGSAPAATVVRPAPLSVAAGTELVRALRGDGADMPFCRACHGAAGGNPFYLRELARETGRLGIDPVATSAAAVGTLGPRAISTGTLGRLARLPGPAVALARAVAVLGLDAAVRHAAALADLDMDAAQAAADALAGVGILEPRRPLNFVHPVVGTAIHADVPAGARSQAHARAADLLATEGADPGAVASHLLLVDPSADATLRARLEHAAADALGRGAPATAARFLRRAVRETPDPAARAPLLVRLGAAELVAGEPSARRHLTEALDCLRDDRLRGETALLLCRALVFAGRLDDVDPLVERTMKELDRPPDDPLLLRLDAERLLVTAFQPRSAAGVARRLPGLLVRADRDGAPGRLIFVAGAMQAAIALERCDDVPRLVDRGLAGGRFIAEETGDSLAAGMAACALAYVDALDAAETYLEQLFDDARARGSVLAYVSVLPWRGWVTLRRGMVVAALADLRSALELAQQHELDFTLPFIRSFLAEALLEADEMLEAEAVTDAIPVDDLPTGSARGIAAGIRGRVRIARGRREEGIADLARAGEYHQAIGHRNPNATHWRSHLAIALGRGSAEALALAESELADARRSGCPRAVGVALRAAGRLRGGGEGLRLLDEAAETLRASPARLEGARTLQWLGAELRHQGHRAAAREPLRQALDIADRLGAARLAAEAGDEFAAAGGRSRRRRLTGAESLTPTERRVADMAASGLRNREIAQALFVSSKTVEMHLGSTYQKLGIHSRADLSRALESEARA